MRIGKASPQTPGLTLPEMFDAAKQGKLRALYIVGSNPISRYSIDPFAVSQSFVVVQDMFLTETATIADVVCPRPMLTKNPAPVTNTCGDLQLLKKAGEVSGTKSDFEMIVRIADAMGYDVRKLVPFGATARTPTWDNRAERSRAKPTGIPSGSRPGPRTKDVAV